LIYYNEHSSTAVHQW